MNLSLPLLFIPALAFSSLPVLEEDAGDELFTENFDSLDQWESLTFKSVPRHSVYRIEVGSDDCNYLHMESNNAGSGLISKDSFDPRHTSIIEWRWRVDQAINSTDHTKRSGDDYPIRVSVTFKYEGTGLGLTERLRYRFYRSSHGEYPPHSALTYVWTASAVDERIYRNPFTQRVGMVVLRGKETPLGEWQDESIDVLADYEKVFGEAPPGSPMRIAIMTDSDDTGQSTRAAINSIRILRK